jgi:hypothetical protein
VTVELSIVFVSSILVYMTIRNIMYLIIALIVVYTCVVWLASRWLGLASLPDRCFLSEDKPDSTVTAAEIPPPTTPDECTPPTLLPTPNARPTVETVVVPPYK